MKLQLSPKHMCHEDELLLRQLAADADDLQHCKPVHEARFCRLHGAEPTFCCVLPCSKSPMWAVTAPSLTNASWPQAGTPTPWARTLQVRLLLPRTHHLQVASHTAAHGGMRGKLCTTLGVSMVAQHLRLAALRQDRLAQRQDRVPHPVPQPSQGAPCSLVNL
jgi:hypothetical protein